MTKPAPNVAPDSVREFETHREAAKSEDAHPRENPAIFQHSFHFCEPEASTLSAVRNLPHWRQPEVCYFVTFRTADSLPLSIREEWNARRQAWLTSHGIDGLSATWHAAFEALPKAQRDEYHRTFSSAMQAYLDAGHGECLLKNSSLRNIVANSLHYFDGERYILGGFVVMPNHVHVLVECLGTHDLSEVCYSWKHFTAHEIHKTSGRTGHGKFWQDESFDHIVRTPEQFQKFRHYLSENPATARLSQDAFSLFLPHVDPTTLQRCLDVR